MLIDGAIRVRRAAVGDAARMGVLVRSLSSDSIVQRFMGGVSRGFATEELCREVGCDGADFALIAENDSGEIVGEAYAAMLSTYEAEASFVVRDRDQHHGIGTALLAGIIAELRARGIRTLHAYTSYGNVAMLALLHAYGFPLDELHLNGGVHVTLEIGG